MGLSHQTLRHRILARRHSGFYIELLDKLDRTKDQKLLLPFIRVPGSTAALRGFV